MGMCDDYPTGLTVFISTSAVTQPLTIFSPFWVPSIPCGICGAAPGTACCLVAHYFAANPRENTVGLYCSCPRCTPTY